jgi:hypothetical protein
LHFPELFKSEAAQFLFVDSVSQEMFLIQPGTEKQILIVPAQFGCTSIALKKKRSLVFGHDAEHKRLLTYFVHAIDNCASLFYVDSLLVAPLYDSDGALRGCLQLYNISESTSLQEVEMIVPALGEVIRLADEAKRYQNMCVEVNKKVIDVQQSFRRPILEDACLLNLKHSVESV